MALTDSNGMSPADFAAVMGNNGNDGFGFGGNGAWWILILFLWSMGMNGGYGMGMGGGMMPWMFGQMNTNNDVQRNFDQLATSNAIGNLTNAVTNGNANILQGINAYQSATNQGMNSLAMSLQNCCCENRAATADLKYTVATEACSDRNAIQQAAQQLSTTYAQGNQAILDKLCQLEMDGVKQNYDNRIYAMQNTIDTLRSQLNEGNRVASQTAQTAQILADNAAQTAALENYLNPPAKPAYIVQNPNCCQQMMWNNCAYGMN